jgi:N-methylhydantoinase A
VRRIGIDTGGTFTDAVFLDTTAERLVVSKVPSRPAAPDRAVLDALAHLLELAAARPADVDFLAHGTTIATNAAITGGYGRAGMITTRGARDVLEIGTQMRPLLYKLDQVASQPLIPRDLRIEVPGRLALDGTELEALDEPAVYAAAAALLAANVESVAIGGLFSFLHPRHERRIAEILAEAHPDLYAVRSSAVSSEPREYARFATAALNAALAPILDRYIGRLLKTLRAAGYGTEPVIMQSNGGVVTARRSMGESAHRLVLSGPAAGVLGGAWVAGEAGIRDVITLDMGGTSADIGIVLDGRPRIRNGMRLENGLPLQIQTLEIEAIGAGGGSIAWVDDGGALHVGPQSAGADPGPACYGTGGTAPTVTDAHVVLGRIDPHNFLGGAIPLDPVAAESAMAPLASLLGCSLQAAAAGIVELAEANMAGAMRRAAARHGDDLRTLALVAAGGAGPLHAAQLAAEFKMPAVCVPPYPGLLSALGLLAADLRHDLSAALLTAADRPDLALIDRTFRDLEGEAGVRFQGDGIPDDRRRFDRALDLRYLGQEYALSVTTRSGEPFDDIVAHFHEQHERVYGHGAPGEPVEVVAARLTAWGMYPRLRVPPPGKRTASPLPGRRDVWFAETRTPLPAAIVARDTLAAGDVVDGPAVIEQLDTTTLVPPSQHAWVHPSGSLIIERRQP